MPIIYQSIADLWLWLVGADGTADGVQYGDVISTTTADEDVIIFEDAMGYVGEADLIGFYYILVCAFKANSSGTADVKWKAQIRNKDGTWVDLFAYQTYADIGTSYLDKKMEGYAKLQTNFNEMPFDFRIVFQCNELNEGRAKLKNSSLLKPIYKRRF